MKSGLSTSRNNRAGGRDVAPRRPRPNCAAACGADGAARRPYLARRARAASGFTLAEVLAALLFMAIVIPVAIEALHLASVCGELSVRKSQAALIAGNILDESNVTTNWSSSAGGTVVHRGHEYHWTLRNETWSADSAMQLVTADVSFSAQGREYSIHMSTVSPGTFAGMQ